MNRTQLLASDLSPVTRRALEAVSGPPTRIRSRKASDGLETGKARTHGALRVLRPTLPADEAAALGVLVFWLPLPARLNNGSVMTGHWRARHHERERWMADADTDGPHPAVPRLPIFRARLAAKLVMGGAMDDDNAMSRVKVALDWLVQRGYLRTDRKRLGGAAALEWAGFPVQEIRRDAGLHRLVLRLTPLSPDAPEGAAA